MRAVLIQDKILESLYCHLFGNAKGIGREMQSSKEDKFYFFKMENLAYFFRCMMGLIECTLSPVSSAFAL